MQFMYGIAKNRKAVRLMKCPKCGINLLEHVETCPFCKTPISANVTETQNQNNNSPKQNTGRFSAVDPKRESYDFDLQYTLTFKDSGEIKQAIADMDAGITPNILNERVSDGSKKRSEARYTLEEMQAAALRSQERRELRKSGKSSKGISAPKKRISSTERNKLSAMRAAKEKAPKSNGDSKSNLKGLLFGAGVLVLVVAIIIGIVNVCAFFAHNDPEYPTVYTKGNELYSFYDGKEELLTSNFITVYSDANAEQDKKSSSDSKIDTVKQLTEKNIIFVSDTGAVTYFFENFNMNTRAGNLVYYENGREKSRTVLGQNVYYDVEIGSNGSSILYLKNADENGAHGELCYWNPKLKGEVSIESDITANNFKFSQDCTSVTYIKNFNPDVLKGMPEINRAEIKLLDADIRNKNFDEAAFTFTREEAMKEAERCLECGCSAVYSCELLPYARDYEAFASGIYGKTRQYPKDKSHPFIVRDNNKCILCGQCVRACKEISGTENLGLFGRGFGTLPLNAFDLPLGESKCVSCGACVNVCPTGALTTRVPTLKNPPLPFEDSEWICEFCDRNCKFIKRTINGRTVKMIPEKIGESCSIGAFLLPVKENSNSKIWNSELEERIFGSLEYFVGDINTIKEKII